MSPRTGRPKSENPKSYPIHVRIEPEMEEKLAKYCEEQGCSRAEAIRRGIIKLLEEEK